MSTASAPIGLYIHVPFCKSKCAYCDFYSLAAQSGDKMDSYTAAAKAAVLRGGAKFPRRADTLYFGGGTPTLLGAERLGGLIAAARQGFALAPDAEVTVEMNPMGDEESQRGLLCALRAAGVNRLSVGLQSAAAAELELLGRRHTAAQAARAVEAAQAAGFANISLDLMLGIPRQTAASVENSVAFCAALGVSHISAYILKIEDGTAFAKNGTAAICPTDDEQAELYLLAVGLLAQNGYAQYEISNFAKAGCESRHNLKYWNGGEYLGIGPAAHSLMNGERFYYPRSLNGFIADSGAVLRENGDTPAAIEGLCGGAGADIEEYMMLRLRLASGLCFEELTALYPEADIDKIVKKAAPMVRAGLCRATKKALSLTAEGFLVSNAVILRLIP